MPNSPSNSRSTEQSDNFSILLLVNYFFCDVMFFTKWSTTKYVAVKIMLEFHRVQYSKVFGKFTFNSLYFSGVKNTFFQNV